MNPIQVLILILFALLDPQGEDPARETPRATLERGAYVEEYDRDLEEAAEIYTRAEEAARAAGDEATASEAAAARRRVEARLGKGPDGAIGSQEQEIVLDRIADLLAGLSEVQYDVSNESPEWGIYKGNSSDLAVYGSIAVPWLEALLEPRAVPIAGTVIQLDTRLAARLLAELGTEEADAALGRGLSSKDPLVRRAVTDRLDAYRHRALLEAAAADPVPQVRTLAVRELLKSQDPALLPLVEREAAKGSAAAVRWMVGQDPRRLLEMMAAPDADANLRDSALESLHRGALPAEPGFADTLLRLAREGDDTDQRRLALTALSNLTTRGRAWEGSAAVRAHLQDRLLAEPERYPAPEVFELLSQMGDVRSFEYFSRELARWPEGRTDEEARMLRHWARQVLQRARVEDFGVIAGLFRDVPLPPGSPAGKLTGGDWHARTLDRLSDLSSAGPERLPSAVVADGYRGLDGPRKSAYHYVVRHWVEAYRTNGNRRREQLADLVPAMRDMLASGVSRLTSTAIRGLSEARDIDSLPAIIQYGSTATDEVFEAFQTFRSDPDRTSELIEEAIRDGRIPYDSIEYLHAPHDLALFRRLWPDAEGDDRQGFLASVVFSMERAEADAVILEHYREIDRVGTRERAIARFAKHLYEPAIPILGEALEDPSELVRSAAREAFHAFKEHREALEEFAAWTLGDRQAREQIDELIQLLASQDEEVALGAIRALGAVRARAALPDLVRTLERENERIRAAVHEAIGLIGR